MKGWCDCWSVDCIWWWAATHSVWCLILTQCTCSRWPVVDDPVRMFEYQMQSPNSVIKFLSDLYSCQRTANLLYTNDAKVLIDIIVRQLNDLSPGDQVHGLTRLLCVIRFHRVWYQTAHNVRDKKLVGSHLSLPRVTITEPPQPFCGPFSMTTRVSRCQKRTSWLYGARED